jgi:hypothetical protein
MKQSEVSQYIDATISARIPRGQLYGGISTGTMHTNSCFVVNSPQDLSYNTFGSVTPGTLAACDIVQPWMSLTQVKLSGFYELPWNLQVSGTFQNLAGPAIAATYVATNAQIAPSLGRNLAAGPAATVSIPLIAPNTEFGSRITQLDVRLTKALQFKNVKTSLSLDMYNALNGSPVTGYATQYGQTGAGWLRPTGVLVGRIIKFVYQMNF